jgi:hypothetical protein
MFEILHRGMRENLFREAFGQRATPSHLRRPHLPKFRSSTIASSPDQGLW